MINRSTPKSNSKILDSVYAKTIDLNDLVIYTIIFYINFISLAQLAQLAISTYDFLL
jgi:hypothetical protein